MRKRCPGLVLMCLASMVLLEGISVVAGGKGTATRPAMASLLTGEITSKQEVQEEKEKSNENKKADLEMEVAKVEEQEAVKEETEVEAVHAFREVEEDYFDDALFIGDSRCVGMQLYSGINNATFFCKEGMTCYDMLEKHISVEGYGNKNLKELLKKKDFGKIYLEIGINEMGRGGIDGFIKQYQECVEEIQKLQPEAKIFFLSIMKIRKDRSDTDEIFNNRRIRNRNERLEQLAGEMGCYYVDINEYVEDSNGDLKKEYTYDAVHLLGKYYSYVTKVLKEHGI